MADRAAPGSAAATAAQRSPRSRARRPSQLSIRHDILPEGAGDGCSTTATSDEHRDGQAGDKRERSYKVAIGDMSAATAVADRHVPDNTCEGAVSLMRSRCGLFPSLMHASQVALR